MRLFLVAPKYGQDAIPLSTRCVDTAATRVNIESDKSYSKAHDFAGTTYRAGFFDTSLLLQLQLWRMHVLLSPADLGRSDEPQTVH